MPQNQLQELAKVQVNLHVFMLRKLDCQSLEVALEI